MNRKQLSVLIATVVVVAACIVGMVHTARAALGLLPEPVALAVWLPAGAEVRPEYEVQPGTFTIRVSLEEFKTRFPTGGLVTYPSAVRHSASDQTWRIVLWQQQGGGIFYRATQEIMRPASWPSFADIGEVRMAGNQLILQPVNKGSFAPGAFATIAILVGTAGTYLVSNVLQTKPEQAPEGEGEGEGH